MIKSISCRNKLISIIIICMISFTTSTLSAQIPSNDNQITIDLDKSNYFYGQTISLRGSVSEIESNLPITVQIFNSLNNRIMVKQIFPTDAKTYNYEFTIQGQQFAKQGQYTITVNYGLENHYSAVKFILTVPELISSNYKGFDIYGVGKKFYAIPHVEGSFAFDRILATNATIVADSAIISDDDQSPFYSISGVGQKKIQGFGIPILNNDYLTRNHGDNSLGFNIVDDGEFNTIRVAKIFDFPQNWMQYQYISFSILSASDAEYVFAISDGSTNDRVVFSTESGHWKRINIPLKNNLKLENISSFYWDFNSLGLYNIDNVRLGYNTNGYTMILQDFTLDDLQRKIDHSPPLGPYLIEQDYNGFNIVEYGGFLYAIPLGEGSFDLKRFELNDYSSSFSEDTLGNIKKSIDAKTLNIIEALEDKDVVSSNTDIESGSRFQIEDHVLLTIWAERQDLQSLYPEVTKGNLENLRLWAEIIGWNEDPRLSQLIPSGANPKYDDVEIDEQKITDNAQIVSEIQNSEFDTGVGNLQVVFVILSIAIGTGIIIRIYKKKLSHKLASKRV